MLGPLYPASQWTLQCSLPTEEHPTTAYTTYTAGCILCLSLWYVYVLVWAYRYARDKAIVERRIAELRPRAVRFRNALAKELAEYQNISNDNKRLLFLETPGSDSLRAAQKSGYALTRISNLYPDCKYSFG